MMQYIIDKNHFNGNADDLILREFLTIPDPNLDDTRFFLGLLRNARLYPQDKRAIRNKIVRKYLKTRFGHLQPPGRG